MATIFVTGGAGYIGSHTVVELVSAGYEVVLVDNFSNSSPEVLQGMETITGVKPTFVEADCSDISAMRQLFSAHPGIQGIIHFAALKAVGESVEKPLQYYHNNLLSTINMLAMMNEFKVKNLVFSSSCTVYGQPDELPVTEHSPMKPALSPYGNTKKICEDIIRDAVTANPDIRAIALRYFNPIGAHSSARIGEQPRGKPDNLVPFITQTAAGVRSKLQIFGDDYNSPDGTAIRDYFHVVDLAKAHILAVERLMSGRNRSNFEVFNVGSGRGVTVLEIVRAFMAVTGVNVPYEIVGRRVGDIEKVWADTSLAHKELGWKPLSSLEDALLSAWRWEKRLRGL